MVKSRLPVFTERFMKLRGEMTQSQFADVLGLSRPTVSLYESGERVPDAVTLRLIAEKTNVSADYLLGLRDDPTADKDLQAIVDYTGLSSEALTKIHNFSHLQGHESGVLDNFNAFIVRFYSRFLLHLSNLERAADDTKRILDEAKDDAPFSALKIQLNLFYDFCRSIPNTLFNSGELIERIEKLEEARATHISEDDIEDFIKGGMTGGLKGRMG